MKRPLKKAEIPLKKRRILFKKVDSGLNFLLKFAPILMGILFPIAAYADCTGSAGCDEHKLRIIVGGQFSHRSPEVHYKEKAKSSPREVNIQKDFADDSYLLFPSLRVEYQHSRTSSWDLTYSRDHTDTSASTKERIKFFFFPIVLSLRVPVKIDTQSVRLFYNCVFFQSGDLQLGGSLGLEALNVYAEAKVPIWGKQTEDVTVPLPALGVFASYKLSDNVMFRLRTNYFSLGSLSLGSLTVGGTVTEMDFSLEYQLTTAWMLGAGYRYSSVKVELDQEKYHANGSYTTYGPTLFIGFSF